MTNETANKLHSLLENAKPLDEEKVNEAFSIFNERMKSAKIEYQRRNRETEILASQARLTT